MQNLCSYIILNAVLSYVLLFEQLFEQIVGVDVDEPEALQTVVADCKPGVVVVNLCEKGDDALIHE